MKGWQMYSKIQSIKLKEARCVRHYLGKFLLRHGHRYRGGKQWTLKHRAQRRHISLAISRQKALAPLVKHTS